MIKFTRADFEAESLLLQAGIIPCDTAQKDPRDSGDYIISLAEKIKGQREEQLKVEPGWISVKDRLPDKLALSGQYEDYLVTRNGHVLIAHWTSGGKFYQSFNGSAPIAVDFWMPLPDPPRED